MTATASPLPQPTATPTPLTDEQREVARQLGAWVVIPLAVLAATLVAYLLYRFVRRLRRAWQPETDADETGPATTGEVLAGGLEVDVAELATAVERAEATLSRFAEPGDAVIAAWVVLEDEAGRQGVGRTPAQTPTEFTSALLAHTAAPDDAVATLRGLYQRARFTAHPVSAEDVRLARATLGRIAAALDAASATAADLAAPAGSEDGP